MMKNSKLPTFEELMAGIRSQKAMAEAKKRAEEERERQWQPISNSKSDSIGA